MKNFKLPKKFIKKHVEPGTYAYKGIIYIITPEDIINKEITPLDLNVDDFPKVYHIVKEILDFHY